VNYTDREEKKEIESDMCKLPLAFSNARVFRISQNGKCRLNKYKLFEEMCRTPLRHLNIIVVCSVLVLNFRYDGNQWDRWV